MSQNITRRSVAKGAAWALPAVTIASAAPAATASAAVCSAADKAAIDSAFASATTKALAITQPAWEINLYQPYLAGDGYSTTTYVNVKNISGSTQFVDYSNRLMFDINTYELNTAPNPADPARNGRAMAQATSSWGQFNVDGGSYYNANQIAYPVAPNVRNAAWTATAGALTNAYKWEYYGGAVNNGQEIDFSLGWGDGLEWAGGQSFRYNNYLTITPTNNPAVALAPTFASTGAAPGCQAYYDQKLAQFDAATAGTAASKFTVRGPLGGSYQIGVGQTVDSRTLGNFAGGTTTASTNGIW